MDDTKSPEENLGGRLLLLAEVDQTPQQRAIQNLVAGTRGARARRAGYRTTTVDGRLIGPFNALLRAPEIARNYLGWAESITGAGLPAVVSEAAILAVAAKWGSAYVRYAHTSAARAAGMSVEDIRLILDGDIPSDASEPVRAALLLARALLHEHQVSDELYQTVHITFDEYQLVALTSLIGQYVTTAGLLACFDVPEP